MSEELLKSSEKIIKIRSKYFNELDKNIPRYIAITYTCEHNIEKQESFIKYGACIYVRENNAEVLKKKKILKTATARFNKYPVVFTIPFKNGLGEKYYTITDKIRKVMMEKGCKNRVKITNYKHDNYTNYMIDERC